MRRMREENEEKVTPISNDQIKDGSKKLVQSSINALISSLDSVLSKKDPEIKKAYETMVSYAQDEEALKEVEHNFEQYEEFMGSLVAAKEALSKFGNSYRVAHGWDF